MCLRYHRTQTAFQVPFVHSRFDPIRPLRYEARTALLEPSIIDVEHHGYKILREGTATGTSSQVRFHPHQYEKAELLVPGARYASISITTRSIHGENNYC